MLAQQDSFGAKISNAWRKYIWHIFYICMYNTLNKSANKAVINIPYTFLEHASLMALSVSHILKSSLDNLPSYEGLQGQFCPC